MAVCFGIFPNPSGPFRTRQRVGFGGTFFSFINDPHPASKSEHYARNAQIYCEGATWSKEIKWPDPRGGDAAKDSTEVLS